jgi:hypothetical protein
LTLVVARQRGQVPYDAGEDEELKKLGSAPPSQPSAEWAKPLGITTSLTYRADQGYLQSGFEKYSRDFGKWWCAASADFFSLITTVGRYRGRMTGPVYISPQIAKRIGRRIRWKRSLAIRTFRLDR